MQIFDRREADPDLKGDVELLDVETGDDPRKSRSPSGTCGSTARSSPTSSSRSGRYCNTYGIGGTRTSTEVPFDELLLRMMRAAGALA